MVVEWLEGAENDLRDILNYLRREAGESTARKITGRIRKYADTLGKMPFSAPVELLLESRPEGFRSKVVKRTHKIVYFVGNDKVNIVAVWDCRRDPTTMEEGV